MLQIEEKLAVEVLNYLATKPYSEVFQLVSALQQIKPVVAIEAPKEL